MRFGLLVLQRARDCVVMLPVLASLMWGTGCSTSCSRDSGKAVPASKDAGSVAAPAVESPRVRSIGTERQLKVFHAPPQLPIHHPVRLAETGKAPRRALRYRPAQPGQKGETGPVARSFVIAARVGVRELDQGTWGPRVELPEIRYGLGFYSTAGPATGATSGDLFFQVRGLEGEIGEVDQSDARLAEHAKRGADYFLTRYRKHLERRRLTVRIDPSGRLKELTFSPDLAGKPEADNTRRQIEQILVESIVPLPAQAIGAGARWTGRTVLWRDTSVVTQTAEYELISAKKDRLRIAVKLTQIGERQVVQLPDLPPSVTAELIGLFWRARGEFEVDLTSVTPVSAALEVEMRTHNRLVEPTRTRERLVESLGTVRLDSSPVQRSSTDKNLATGGTGRASTQ
ncbi:MAG: hypothetical protein MJE77_21550 [Proteobacteria bacterium]|nr:hypothetical protein [Pseudomonadota bacterium]